MCLIGTHLVPGPPIPPIPISKSWIIREYVRDWIYQFSIPAPENNTDKIPGVIVHISVGIRLVQIVQVDAEPGCLYDPEPGQIFETILAGDRHAGHKGPAR